MISIPTIVNGILLTIIILSSLLFMITIFEPLYRKIKAWRKIRKRRKHSDLPFFDDDKQRKEIGMLGKTIRDREGIKGFNIFRNICIITWMSRLYNLELGFESNWNEIDYLISLGKEKPSTDYIMRHHLSPDFGITKKEIQTLKPHDILKITHERYLISLKQYYNWS